MQTFQLLNQDTNESVPLADNLSRYSLEYIKFVIEKQILNRDWELSGNYIAIGSDDERITYSKGVIKFN